MNAALARRFVTTAVSTAGPQQVLTMLYDRLVLDLARAEASQRAGDRSAAAAQLDHAHDVVAGLASMLEVDAWTGGRSLMDLYTYLLGELIGCSLAADADRTARCRDLVVPLRDAWREAATSLAAVPTIPTQRSVPAAFGERESGGELGVG